MKINKQIKLALLLCFITIVTFAQTAQRGEQNPPMPGIGVVVKKNPGGGASKMVVTNEKGEATLAIKEPGNYTLTLTQTQGKSAGEPLPGLIIKGGCNVCPKRFTVTTNEKGEADLKDLEKGDYTFTVEQRGSTDVKVLEKLKEREERFAKSDEIDGHVTLLKKNGEKARTALTIGVRVNYFIPISEQKTNTSPFLFLKSGQSAELDLNFVPKNGTTRYTLSAGYFFGTNDKESILSYSKEKDIPYDTYKFTKSNPSGFSLLVGPKIMLFPKSENKKLPLMWLNLNAGAMYTNQQTLQYFQGQNTTPIAEVKTNSLNFIYQPSIEVNIIKTKKMFINARAGYSNFGGFTFGVSIAERDCNGAPCCKCPFPGFCNPCATESNENISK